MKVSAQEPFEIIYSIYTHEYLGYLIESYAIQLDAKGRPTLLHQNISSKNADEFAERIDELDYKIISITDSLNQNAVIRYFNQKWVKPEQFFPKVFDREKGDKALQGEIKNYVERNKARLLKLISSKPLYEMGRDGEPAWKRIHFEHEPATILFHFIRNEDNTHYFPTIKHEGSKLDFQYNGSYILCNYPAWLICNNKLIHFEKLVDGKKIKPFLNKKFIVIPKKVEETYFKKFVAPLIAAFNVHTVGFKVEQARYECKPKIVFSEMATVKKVLSLFGDNDYEEENEQLEEPKILFELFFQYGPYTYRADHLANTSVDLEKNGDSYVFYKVERDHFKEKEILGLINELGFGFMGSRSSINREEALDRINEKREILLEHGISIEQKVKDQKKYFIGKNELQIDIKENIDWFDIYAEVKFGDCSIPFHEIVKLIKLQKSEIRLDNGEIAIIPRRWIEEYSELFAFSQVNDGTKVQLPIHHLAIVNDLKDGNLAKVNISKKLENLSQFKNIEDKPLSKHFKGELRPYQKAGYNWLLFLNKFQFGGCLADDMGLGKTVQTLAMLQYIRDLKAEASTSLLIMPTSLVYNWEMEAKKFTPKLKVLVYTGTYRDKNPALFAKYDLVITTYGTVRIDIDIIKEFYFNYVILDESQAIKNPESNIAKAVKKLNTKQRLVLSGTPIENTTLDLWSQMAFINPGLLGNKNFFMKEYLLPIEKKGDQTKRKKLHMVIKPFILRRHKSQVATDLPEKVENIRYCVMTKEQEEVYEQVRDQFRLKIIESIKENGMKGSQLLILQGLTQLRQLANHPRMLDPEYEGSSGKLDEVMEMLHETINEGHKILIFSQFVKHLSVLRHHLNFDKIPHAYLDGSTKNRQAQIELFQNNKDIPLFLISMKAGGVGLNLTQADYVFILDPWWNPAVEAQAIDRAHRIGQKKTVFTYKFISKDTIEEKILRLQENKLQLASDLITTEESFFKQLSKNDISALLD